MLRVAIPLITGTDDGTIEDSGTEPGTGAGTGKVAP
jgi:hypothetical protein